MTTPFHGFGLVVRRSSSSSPCKGGHRRGTTLTRQGLLLAAWLLLALLQGRFAFATNADTTGTGELIVFSPSSRTLVVDIIRGQERKMIGGKLSENAVILVGEHHAQPGAFQVGDVVEVSWNQTRNGKQIVRLFKQGTIAHDVSTPPLSSPTAVGMFKRSPLPAHGTRTYSQTAAAYPGAVATMRRQGDVIGLPSRHQVKAKETLLDIAREHGLGFHELSDLYPELDPWLPPEGASLPMPTEHILPDGIRSGIVINIPEMRLYHFSEQSDGNLVHTFPVSIGDPPYTTPTGTYSIANKVTRPTWFIPPSLRAKYQISSVPPGPDNPLGNYWMGLSGTMIGIHGTDIAWSIGRTVTHGCIRMYPEDIRRFFPTVKIGSDVHIVYQPVKISLSGERILLEVHRDIYNRHSSLVPLATNRLLQLNIWHQVDHNKLVEVIEEARGIPVDIRLKQSSVADSMQSTLPTMSIP